MIVWDFTSILALLTFLSGFLWLIEAKVFKPHRIRSGGKSQSNFLFSYSKSFFPVFLFVFILRGFIVEPFRIPSGSMIPTLLVGDFILVDKFSYGLRMPFTNQIILETGTPKRGDVVVFKYPLDPSTPFIKRVIGIPGDRVEYIDKTLRVNEQTIAWENESTFIGHGKASKHTGASVHREEIGEFLHQVLISPSRYSKDGEYEVPENMYFVMGDNRDNSRDSRFWGFVPESHLMGKAFFIWLNWDGGVNFNRSGLRIDENGR
jgi:signal peptidase I